LPGSGKTHLVQEWLRVQQVRAAWIACGAADNDPAIFSRRLIQALGAGVDGAPLMAVPFPTSPEAAIAALGAWLAAQPQPRPLVLDDWDRIQSAGAQEVLRCLLQSSPPTWPVYITSRMREVGLPLTRWAAAGHLRLITPADLAFTLEETRQVIQGCAPHYTEADVQTLHRYTGGWIAGLRLALLGADGRWRGPVDGPGDPQQWINALCAEIWPALPTAQRRFAEQTAILDPVTAELGQAVAGEEHSAPLLAALADHGILVAEEGHPGHFRFPDFWRDFLLPRVENRATLHRRAALWYAAVGAEDQAMEHALAAHPALAVELLHQYGRDKINRGELLPLRHWLAALPESVIQGDGELGLIYAWALVHGGELDQAERYLQHPAQPVWEINAIRARIAALRGDKPTMIAFSEQALPHLPAAAFALRADLLLNMGCAYLDQGEIAPAQSLLTQAWRWSRTAPQERAAVFAGYFLGKVRLAQGRLQQAQAQYDTALQAYGALPIAGVLHVGLAEICYEHNDLAAARQHLDQAIRMGEQAGEIKPLVYANIAFGALLSPHEALQRLEYAAQLTNWSLIYAWQAVWWVRAGNLRMATYWLEDTLGGPSPLSEGERLIQARVLLALGRWEEAAQVLDAAQARAVVQRRDGDLIRILLLQAQRHRAHGDQDRAVQCVAQAVAHGERQGYLRTFLDEGASIAQLCTHLMRQQPASLYLHRLVQHFPAPSVPPRPLPFGETLSQREGEVLQLVAEGASNEEIAAQLFLTTGTVKWHIHNIFGKLDAKNRTQAVKKAQSLGLLSA
jgi:LuxR family maltose regulon positive regulatory protein